MSSAKQINNLHGFVNTIKVVHFNKTSFFYFIYVCKKNSKPLTIIYLIWIMTTFVTFSFFTYIIHQLKAQTNTHSQSTISSSSNRVILQKNVFQHEGEFWKFQHQFSQKVIFTFRRLSCKLSPRIVLKYQIKIKCNNLFQRVNS